ncbi:MAG: hypothetical protein CO068_04640 [Flavobacteriaceae bacterium CG_4_9_14_0_8_um_filter_34_30]|nr:WecB/TagA/CpsF family glycosyltransferase [Bacteroidota bacterium]PJC07735.1 MAG: hypothetical protein CO068_04640 [Flavobacteriaceae bacterium CG_4_9_14_0_8_um_filter_34_30]
MIRKIVPKLVNEINYKEKGVIVSYLNAYNYLKLRKHNSIVSQINIFTLDGILLVFLFKILFNKKIARLSPDYSSYFKELFLQCELSSTRLFFVGGNKEEISKFIKSIKRKHPKLKISGFTDGYYENENELIFKINKLSPEIVFIGLGSPKQEIFATQLKNNNFTGNIYTCGAFISQTASRGMEYYPTLINKFNLRWVFRLTKEKGLIKRYFIEYPYAVFIILKDYYKK